MVLDKNVFEGTLAAHGHLLFFDWDLGAQLLWGLNLGIGISTDLDKWSFRPEIGFMKNIYKDAEGTMWNFGLAVSYIIPAKM